MNPFTVCDEHLQLLIEGLPSPARLITRDEMDGIQCRSMTWSRASSPDDGIVVLAVFGINTPELYYCKQGPKP